MAWLALTGLVLSLALAVGAGLLARREGIAQATRTLQDLARVSAPALAPALDAGRSPDPGDAAVIGRQVAILRAARPGVRITVSNASGRVLWSDEPRAAAPGRAAGTRLEADAGVRDVRGTPLRVHLVEPYDQAAAASDPWLRFTPAALGVLVLLQLVQLPLAWRLARLRGPPQVEAQVEAMVLQAAADACVAERRRIARDLHDYVIQDLTALTYDLDAARLRGPGRTADDDLLLIRAASRLRATIADLRTLLGSLMPARVPAAGLEGGLQALGRDLQDGGTRVDLDVEGGAAIPEPAAALLYRCAQEALRNVAAHSGARTVELSVRCGGGVATMVVDDDGCGFDEDRLRTRHAAGHVGLRALDDLLTDAGGDLTVASATGVGTRMVMHLPLPRRPVGDG